MGMSTKHCMVWSHILLTTHKSFLRPDMTKNQDQVSIFASFQDSGRKVSLTERLRSDTSSGVSGQNHTRSGIFLVACYRTTNFCHFILVSENS